jgi:hypothetical protein
MLQSPVKEIVVEVVVFIRVCISATTREQLDPVLQALVC